MKETYVKPTIFIERFSLTQNIANGCGGIASSLGSPGQADKFTCSWNVGTTTFLFTNTVEACFEDVGENDEVFGVCYNAPNSNNAVFGA